MKLLLVCLFAVLCVAFVSCTYPYQQAQAAYYPTKHVAVPYPVGYAGGYGGIGGAGMGGGGAGGMGGMGGAFGGIFQLIIFIVVFVLIINLLTSTVGDMSIGVGGSSRRSGGSSRSGGSHRGGGYDDY